MSREEILKIRNSNTKCQLGLDGRCHASPGIISHCGLFDCPAYQQSTSPLTLENFVKVAKKVNELSAKQLELEVECGKAVGRLNRLEQETIYKNKLHCHRCGNPMDSWAESDICGTCINKTKTGAKECEK